MLRHRRIHVENGSNSLYAYLKQGCPHGGVLSPLIYSLVVDSLRVSLTNEGFFTIGHADDIVILVLGKHLHTLTEVVEKTFGSC